MRKIYVILFWVCGIMGATTFIQCSHKSSESVNDNTSLTIEPVVINIEEAISKANDKIPTIEADSNDVIYFDASGNASLSDFEVQDISDDKILLSSKGSVFVYEMPSGKCVQTLSKKGDGHDEYKNIVSASFLPSSNIGVLESIWQDTSSNIIEYDSLQNVVSRTSIPFVGDLIRLSDGDEFISPKAISRNGGDSKIYHFDNKFNIIDSLDCNKHYTEGSVFFMFEYINKYSRTPSLVLRDTLFHITSDFQFKPVIFLDLGGKGMPEGFSRRNYDSFENYQKDYAKFIDPTLLQELCGMLFARIEHENKIYFCIWEIETGTLLYSHTPTSSEWGFNLNIGGTIVNQWPVGEWNDKLMFYLPQDSNPGLAFIPVSKVKKALLQ